MVVVEAALAPANISIDNEPANVKGPTDDEGKIVQPESNETVKDTVHASEPMATEDAAHGRERHIWVSDSDGKTQHPRARIHHPKFGRWYATR